MCTRCGGENPTVTVYWGTTDAADAWGDWSNNYEIGVREVGAFNQYLLSLSSNTTYYFRFRAVNSAGAVSTATGSFTTLKPASSGGGCSAGQSDGGPASLGLLLAVALVAWRGIGRREVRCRA